MITAPQVDKLVRLIRIRPNPRKFQPPFSVSGTEQAYSKSRPRRASHMRQIILSARVLRETTREDLFGDKRTMMNALKRNTAIMIRSTGSWMARLPTGGNSQMAKVKLADNPPTSPDKRPQNNDARITVCRQMIGADNLNSHPSFVKTHNNAATPAQKRAPRQTAKVFWRRRRMALNTR